VHYLLMCHMCESVLSCVCACSFLVFCYINATLLLASHSYARIFSGIRMVITHTQVLVTLKLEQAVDFIVSEN